MTADLYAGLDLLADVFEGTADAPVPIWNYTLTALWPSPDDPRWDVDMAVFASWGQPRVWSVRSVTPSGSDGAGRSPVSAHAPAGVEPSPAVSAPARGTPEPA